MHGHGDKSVLGRAPPHGVPHHTTCPPTEVSLAIGRNLHAVINQPIHRCHSHGACGEHVLPLTKRLLVCRQEATALVAVQDQQQHQSRGLILAHVAVALSFRKAVVDDHQQAKGNQRERQLGHMQQRPLTYWMPLLALLLRQHIGVASRKPAIGCGLLLDRLPLAEERGQLQQRWQCRFQPRPAGGTGPAGHGAGAPSAASRSAVRVAVGDFTHLDRAGVPRPHSHKNIVSKTLVREGLQLQSLDLQVPLGAVAAIEDGGVLGEQLP